MKSWGEEEETIQQIPISTLCILNSYNICKRKNKYNWNNVGVKKSREEEEEEEEETIQRFHSQFFAC